MNQSYPADQGYTVSRYSYFGTLTFVKLFLLINFYFSSMSLHYPIFLLPLDEFIANDKQTYNPEQNIWNKIEKSSKTG